jgi:thiol-disulfide isomerase/thioredoxin
MTSLLRSRSIQRELMLSPHALRQIEDPVNDIDLPLWRLRNLPSDKRNEQVLSLIDRLKTRLSGVFTPQQMERFNQILWQALGIDALLEPEVATRLRLSEDQVNTILVKLNAGYQRILDIRLNTEIRSASIRDMRLKQVHEETRQGVMAALNSLQRSSFRRLLGQSINLSKIREIACKAPEIEADAWINAKPLKLSELKGKVTVVHFYALGCGNCVRSLPYYTAWHRQFDTDTFAIVGIHRPESAREHNIDLVKEKAVQAHMDYPIAIDNQSLAWHAWGNPDWPTTYLIDKSGYIRYWWYGELNWKNNGSEKYLRERIQALIREPAQG